MSYGPIQEWTCQAASGTSTSSYIDMGGKSYTRIAVKYTTMSTGALVSVYGSESSTGTFGQIYQLVPSTATVAYQPVQIGSAISGQNWAIFQAPPLRYLQFITSAVVSGGVSYVVKAMD